MTNSLFTSLGAWNWFIFAALLGVAEMLMPGIYMMWYAVAAILVGGLALAFDISWQMQLAAFAMAGFALLLLARRLSPRALGESDHPLLNSRAEALVGRTFELIEPTENGRGRVKVGDGTWKIRLEEDDSLPVGTKVLITGARGATLIGRRA